MSDASIIFTKSQAVRKSEQLMIPLPVSLADQGRLQRLMSTELSKTPPKFLRNVMSSFRAELHRSTAIGRVR